MTHRADVDIEDHRLAADIVQEAGGLLLSLRANSARARRESLSALADRTSDQFIRRWLVRVRPDDPILSEEDFSGAEQLPSRRIWVVDPLDGSREYGERGRSDWAAQLALVVDNLPRAGAVALPAQTVLATTLAPPRLASVRPRKPRIAISRTRPPTFIEGVADALGATLLPLGSAGAKTLAVILGHADVYLHAGGQYEWDSAGPVAVALASGLHASRIDGSPLRYNQGDPWLPDILICRPELARSTLRAVEAVRGQII